MDTNHGFMQSKFLYPSTLLAVAVLSFLAGCGDRKAAPPQQAATAAAPPAVPVDIVIAREEALKQHEVITGTIIPSREVIIRSEVSQRILRVGFRDGTGVSQGQLLYKLNDAELQAKLKQVLAELKLAGLNAQRLAELLKTEAIKPQEYDEAATRLSILQAQKELLDAEIAKTVITAPFSGRIGISGVVAGAYVTPSTELVNLQDQGLVKLNFSVPEKYLPLVRTGSKVHFSTELSPEQYGAIVKATEPGVNPENRSIPVQAEAANPGGKLRAGLSAKVFFPTAATGARAITIPTEALIPGSGGYAVYVMEAGVAKVSPVTIGSRTESHAVITSGLRDGDSIIVSNILRLGDGTPVQAVASK